MFTENCKLLQDIPGFVPGEDHYKYFDSPWTSLVKTGTMFVGTNQCWSAGFVCGSGSGIALQ
jgi:hypothetical protein